jgi:hypothetical protein
MPTELGVGDPPLKAGQRAASGRPPARQHHDDRRRTGPRYRRSRSEYQEVSR